jgi:hypothetical protein
MEISYPLDQAAFRKMQQEQAVSIGTYDDSDAMIG